MERAIAVMRRSIAEKRPDQKASPLVGAVLWKPGGTVDTGCRGELRDGDHAEFTVMERKNRSNALDGAVLFSTLEPCAPGARRPPKLGCAERIVSARIKEICVGIEDPDPTVDRKGIKFLQDAGIAVHMFDRDLQEVICEANRDFIAQAMERARSASEEKPKEVALSSLEGILPSSHLGDLSKVALAEYRTRARIQPAPGSSEFNDLLRRQGLLKRDSDGKLTAAGFGFLLFGKEPRKIIHQAGLLAMIRYSANEEERREFDEPMVIIPLELENWLRSKLPLILDRKQTHRREIDALQYELVREGVVNALIHRNYDIAGAKIQLTVTRDVITIQSPGLPPDPVTLDQLQSFTAPMLSRNPLLHYVFAKMEMAEEQGLGIRSMQTKATQLGLPLPTYTWNPPYLTLTLYRTPSAATGVLSPEVFASLTESERRGWTWLSTVRSATAANYARELRVDQRTARRHLSHFDRLGLVGKRGSGPATRYVLR